MFFKRSALIILLINCCASLFCQTVNYSKEYPTARGHVPLKIINNNAGYFYVLRYNKAAHDFTIERRSKPEAGILSFTPLKLDSVNANWFDYENLDYLAFELEGKMYFVFEKTLNTKKTIYLKEIDTTGKSSGFRELASLDKDASMSDFRFVVKLAANNKLLIVGEQYYLTNTAKKVAMLIDLQKNEKLWVKKLPPENEHSGYSADFDCNQNNDLYYTQQPALVAGFKRRYQNNAQVNVPVLSYDSLVLLCLPNDSKTLYRRKFSLRDSTGKKSVSLFPGKNEVTVLLHGYTQNQADDGRVFFLARKFTNTLTEEIYSSLTPLDPVIEKQLTFYDGSDYKSPADKDHVVTELYKQSQSSILLAGREEENFYKELLLLKTDLTNGKVLSQRIVPRKLFYFDDRTRFKNMGLTASVVYKEAFFTFLLENRNNERVTATLFNYHHFNRQKHVWGGNLVTYMLRENGDLEKKVIYRSGNFDFIPLAYSGSGSDFVFYLNNGKREKFAILNLDSL